MPDNMTNVEFVTELMEFSPQGALTQIFIIEAISRYARSVAVAEPEDVDHPMIHGASWVATAKEVVRRLDEMYGAPPAREMRPQKVQLFAALLEADEAVVGGYEVEEFHLTPSPRAPQTYLWTANEQAIELDDQEIELTDDDDASIGRFVDIKGERHDLVLHRVVRQPLHIRQG